MLNKTLLLAIAAVGYIFVSCNNEPPECGSDEFPPFRCQFEMKSGRKVDSISVYHVNLDSVLYSGTTVVKSVDIPLEMEDTTFVVIRIVGKSKTYVGTYVSMLGLTSTPELTIENLECGPFYCFRDIESVMYSTNGYQDTYVIDTLYEDRVDSVLVARYDTVYRPETGNKDILRIDTMSYYEKYDTTYIYTDRRKTGVEYVTFPMAVDSMCFYKTEVTQEHEAHAKIFM